MFSIRRPYRRCVVRYVLAIAVIGVFGQSAFAAERPANQAPKALQSALRDAWQHHPDSRSIDAQLSAARARLQAASQPLYNPELVLSQDEDGPERTIAAGMNLTLDLAGKRRARRDAASAQVALTTAEAQVLRRDFVRDWLLSWSDTRNARRRLAIGNRRQALLQRFAELARKQFSVGDISGLERDLALFAREQSTAENAQLMTDLIDAEARFRVVGGVTETAHTESPFEFGAPEMAQFDSGTQALPEWLTAKSALDLANREVIVANKNRQADPTIGAYSSRKDFNGRGARYDAYGVSISIPLHVRNTYRAEVLAAQSDVDVAEARLKRVELALETNRRRAAESYAGTRAAWQVWQSSQGTDIDRRTDLLEKLWREGEMSTSEYLLQLNQTLEAQMAGLELESRLFRAYTDYLVFSGQLEQWAGMEGAP
ncbi:TolC family protein [Lysobacter sp. HDW10]|uniref:TolC family protein n=1 Tax=Lysobacter sp. HDW10 TaxID=2714936 RepID=UPI001409ED2C|nr:TolC family protein [Lysobacter sp. HDW10]QIK81952.1 TolC family protein [Lysobacter sp. HDW10]